MQLALQKTFSDWLAAYAARDLKGTLSIFADDVIFSFQGSPDQDRSALERGFVQAFAQATAGEQWMPDAEEIECSGDLAFVRSVWILQRSDSTGRGLEISQKNRSIDVLKRSADGYMEDFSVLELSPRLASTAVNKPMVDFDLGELEKAADLVHRIVHPTPQYAWPKLQRRTGCKVWVKHENHTPTGAFKVRGGIVYLDNLVRSQPPAFAAS